MNLSKRFEEKKIHMNFMTLTQQIKKSLQSKENHLILRGQDLLWYYDIPQNTYGKYDEVICLQL